ncbi:hypothetical protein Q5752_005594 [Cryptotrichosporon argae]
MSASQIAPRKRLRRPAALFPLTPLSPPTPSPPSPTPPTAYTLTPSLDPPPATLSFTPPPGSAALPGAFPSTPHNQSFVPTTYAYDPTPGGLKGDVWLGATQSSPPSPATIDSTTDSQTGGEYFPPSSESEEDTVRLQHPTLPSRPSHRRANLSLSIGNLPSLTSTQLASPVSSGAPYTDSLSNTVDTSEDYFQFTDASFEPPFGDHFELPASAPVTSQPAPPGAPGPASAPPQQQAHAFAYRPAVSQPSSPVRGVFLQNQSTYQSTPSFGRQRGATFSGISPFGETFNLAAFQAQMPITALPSHLAFSSLQQSPVSSLAPSPVIAASPAFAPHGDYAQANAGLGLGLTPDVQMEDATTPKQTPQPHVGSRSVPSSRRSSLGAPQTAPASMTPDLASIPDEMAEKLSMIDKILVRAHEAKTALLTGREEQVPGALGDISNQLEIATDLGVGPTLTPRDATPASQSISPHNFSPTNATSAVAQPPVTVVPPTLPTMQMPLQTQLQAPLQTPVAQQPMLNLLPSLPVQTGLQQRVVSAPTLAPQVGMPTPFRQTDFEFADFSQPLNAATSAPPLLHSHSFPNGHQLPSQMHGVVPSTPVVASPSFTAALAQHAPHVSSPLAAMPPSRPASPKPYPIPQWVQPDGTMVPGMPMAGMPHGVPMMTMMTNDVSMTRAELDMPTKPRRQSVIDHRADGRPIVARARSTSNAKPGGAAFGMTSVPPSAWQSRQGSPDDDDDDGDESDDDMVLRKTKRRRSSAGADADAGPSSGVIISDDIRRQLDQIFEEFLNRVCSDLDMCDNKGEKLHQVLMPKKMQRLDESPDYRPFKFRIQAFTNAFQEELQARGITEETMSVKKIKSYLWHQDLISRFNADGKKAKSKGNHIWHVDAKKLPGGGWVFRPFKRRIIGAPPLYAVVNAKYEWEPKIWDPMAPSASIKPTFSSPANMLPPWLQWEDGVRLVGVPDQPSLAPITITAVADFIDGAGNPATLDTTFTLQVVTLPQQPMAMPADPSVVFTQPSLAWPDYDTVDLSIPQQSAPYQSSMAFATGAFTGT